MTFLESAAVEQAADEEPIPARRSSRLAEQVLHMRLAIRARQAPHKKQPRFAASDENF